MLSILLLEHFSYSDVFFSHFPGACKIFLIIPESFSDFNGYLALYQIVWKKISKKKYGGKE